MAYRGVREQTVQEIDETFTNRRDGSAYLETNLFIRPFQNGSVDNAESWRQCVDICKEWLFFLGTQGCCRRKTQRLELCTCIIVSLC